MNKQGSFMVTVLVMLVIIVATSATILILVKTGTLDVRDEGTEPPILNAEFVPFDQGGDLIVEEFKFCSFVDAQFNCVSEGSDFGLGDNVYVRFVIQSSTRENQIQLIRNYRIIDPNGNVVLRAEESNAYQFDLETNKEKDGVVFSNFFSTDPDGVVGEYRLELLLENMLIGKKVVVGRTFTLGDYYVS